MRVRCGACKKPMKVSFRRWFHHLWQKMKMDSVWIHDAECFELYLTLLTGRNK